ncbi:interleukin 5 receptor subunit alpha [Phyllostomus discolor]|uniref:Interleukin 5 receptor subunit alpha n=1 Tax=Phyllostomus discolor TaxID=89673 RepID=A0A833ZUZ3_9CHIR|nr:interleukin 5 receptor subunit alpha [Phyllostomus discolor]
MAPALLILLGAAAILRADGTPDDVSLLPPVNFTIKVTGLAQVLLSWKPNPEQERKGVQLGYHLRVHTPQDDDFELKHTGRRYEAALHRGFSASVRTILWERRPSPASRWVSAELRAPPGSPGTSAVNLTCVTNTAAGGHPESRPYRVSLRCAWRAGEEAPSDTQYFLYYRYGSRTEACREYGQDALRRNVACWFPATSIDGKGQDALAVGVSGSSLRAAIRPYDRLFALHEIDQVNPPGNVTAEMDGTRLSVRWEKPVSAFPGHCWDYEVKIYGRRRGYVQIENTTANKFNTTVSDVSRYCVVVRAAVSSTCRRQGLWSAWSQPVGTGQDEQKPWTEWLLIPLTASLCAAFVCSLSRRTGHVCTKLFPPVPGPKSDIGDLVATVNYEKGGSGETESDVLSYVAVDEEPEVLEDLVF